MFFWRCSRFSCGGGDCTKSSPLSFATPFLRLREEEILYAIDLSPVDFGGELTGGVIFVFLLVEGLIKFIVIGEVFTHLLRRYPSLGRFAKVLISGVGIVLVFAATVIAAYANPTPSG